MKIKNRLLAGLVAFSLIGFAAFAEPLGGDVTLELSRSENVAPDTTQRVYLNIDASFTYTAGQANVAASSTVTRAAANLQEWNSLSTPLKFKVDGSAENEEYLVNTIASNELTLDRAYEETPDATADYTLSKVRRVDAFRVVNTHATQDITVNIIGFDGAISLEDILVEAKTEYTLKNCRALGLAYDAGAAGTATIELYTGL